MAKRASSRGTRGFGTPVPSAIPAAVPPLLYNEFIATPDEIAKMLERYGNKCKPPYKRIYEPSQPIELQIDRRSKQKKN